MGISDYDQDRRPDEMLVRAARAGSQEAFGELFERLYPKLHRILRIQGCSPELAQDLSQEAFLRAYERLDQLRDDRLFRPWLYRTARNLMLATWGREGSHARMSLEYSEWFGNNPGQHPVYQSVDIKQLAERELINQILGQLSELLREAFILRYLGDYRDEEIALIVGISPAAAQRRAHRAKSEFRRWYRQLTDVTEVQESPVEQQELSR